MTLLCAHRVNDPSQLRATPTRLGVEVDLRSLDGELVLEHDPFALGPRFEDWLDDYRHRFIVLNTKEEGLEQRVVTLLEQRGIREWAFLDQSFPFMVRTLLSGESRTMVRLSEFESVETILSLPLRPDWVWVDSFTGQWPKPENLRRLAAEGHKFMVVSPELQGRTLQPEQDLITASFTAAEVPIHGVCTKRWQEWDRRDAPWWAV